jgi:hypothetical protein
MDKNIFVTNKSLWPTVLFKTHNAAYLARNMPYWWAHQVDILVPLASLLFIFAFMSQGSLKYAIDSARGVDVSVLGVFWLGLVMSIILSCFWLVFVDCGI